VDFRKEHTVSVQTTPLQETTVVGLDLVGCTVTDLATSLAFYRDTLGLVPAGVSENGAEFHFPDGTTYGLYQPAGGDVKPGFAVMFKVGDAVAAVKRANDRGASIAEPFESPVCYMAFGHDPEGNSVILHQKKNVDPHTPPAQTYTPATIRGIDIAGYLVADPQRAIAFYRDVLGMTPSEIDADGRGAEFELADGSTFGIWHTPDSKQCGFVMFAVDDARAKVDELRGKGVSMSDVIETPNCTMSFALDPEGTAVFVHQRKVHG
jgi:predicted enzyme related to lactoylglutathione lyase